jgi:hypothetical protein
MKAKVISLYIAEQKITSLKTKKHMTHAYTHTEREMLLFNLDPYKVEETSCTYTSYNTASQFTNLCTC